jgi:hypothetical protein
VLGVDRLDYTKGHPRADPCLRAPARAAPRAPRARRAAAGHRAEPLPGRRVPAAEATDRRAGRPGERPLRNPTLDAHPLSVSHDPARAARGALPRRGRRAGDAAPRRDEPGRQGVRGLPGARARRAGALAPGGRPSRWKRPCA